MKLNMVMSMAVIIMVGILLIIFLPKDNKATTEKKQPLINAGANDIIVTEKKFDNPPNNDVNDFGEIIVDGEKYDLNDIGTLDGR